MSEKFTVKLTPFEIQERVGNLTVTKSMNQDIVIIVAADGKQQMWGYSPTVEGMGTFLPLSGFPKELVGEVQRQINEIRGYKPGEGPPPPNMIATGRTAAEQRAETEDEDEEEFE